MALRPCALSEGPKHCKIHGFAPLRPFRRPQNLMKYMVLRTCAPTPEATTQDRKAGAIQNSSKLDGPGNLSSRRCRASAGLPPGFRHASAKTSGRVDFESFGRVESHQAGPRKCCDAENCRGVPHRNLSQGCALAKKRPGLGRHDTEAPLRRMIES